LENGTFEAAQMMVEFEVCVISECGPAPSEGCVQAVVNPGGACEAILMVCLEN